MRPDYIFIVGASRSGTSLMRKILSKSTDIAICGESYFLGHQIPWEGVRYIIKRDVGERTDDAIADKLVDYLYAGKFKRGTSGYWRWLQKKTSKDDFLEKLLIAGDCSDRTIFATMMEMYGDWARQMNVNMKDNLVLGEKTPYHIYYVPTLLEWFPNSRIVHMLRDPRGVIASELRRRQVVHARFPYKQLRRTGSLLNLFILPQVTYTWLKAAKLHFKYQDLYRNKYYLQRFEDLITDPEANIRKLCDFLEVDFQAAMLEQKVYSVGFKVGQPGFDTNAADRWREINPSWLNSWFYLWGNKYMKALGFTGKL